MTSLINSSDFKHLPSQVEVDFMAALLEPDDVTYPWNPADEESEAYFLQLEQQFVMQDVLEEELEVRSDAFYSQLDQLWSSYKQYECNTLPALVTTLQESLHNSFSSYIPSGWLNMIAHKAVEIFNSQQQSISEQLIECVQSVLPNWATEDLLVLARPMAYAMRGSEPNNVHSLLENVDDPQWTSLSQIEQAKISLAVAYYAFGQLNNVSTET